MKIFAQILVIFTLVATGYICKKLKVISDDMNKDVGNLLVYLSLPSLIIISLSNFNFSKKMLFDSSKLLVISFSLYILYILLSYIFPKILRAKGTTFDIFQFAIVFGNTGFIGFPIAHAVFGEKGVFYMAIFDIFFNIFVWTFGVMVLSRPMKNIKESDVNNKKKFLLQLIKNPNIIAICIGFILFLTSTKLPFIINEPLKLLASLTTPLSMIFVGSTLGNIEAKEIIKDIKVFLCSLKRLIVLPLIVLGILKILHFNGYMISIPVLYTAMPVAASTPILASKFNNDYFLASKVVFVSTILSVVTLPFIVSIIL